MTAIIPHNLPGHAENWAVQLPEDWDDDRFFKFCRDNHRFRIERDADGSVHLMPPTGLDTGDKNSNLTADLSLWRRKNDTGKTGDSSTGYRLLNGAVRSPDASFVSYQRLSGLTKKQLQKFPPVSPEFVAEIRSPSDSLKKLQEKMQEYISCGVLLAWLFDLKNEAVYIYRADGSTEKKIGFTGKLSGENVLPGFEFDLKWMK